MKNPEFLNELQKRATEQQVLSKGIPFSRVFFFLSYWLGNHPWRILIPFSFLLTILFHNSLGIRYDEMILKLFGKI